MRGEWVGATTMQDCCVVYCCGGHIWTDLCSVGVSILYNNCLNSWFVIWAIQPTLIVPKRNQRRPVKSKEAKQYFKSRVSGQKFLSSWIILSISIWLSWFTPLLKQDLTRRRPHGEVIFDVFKKFIFVKILSFRDEDIILLNCSRDHRA